MNHQDLITLLSNREVTMSILNILAAENESLSGSKKTDEALEKTLNVFSNTTKPRPPGSIDIRGKGHRQASRLAKTYDFKVGDKIDVWSEASESGLRRAFAGENYKVSIDNVGNKKRTLEILEYLSNSGKEYSYARKKKA
jgi:hypothetical protein